ncbi:sigma factor-like helix-turn-helix DNA-binding protein [Kitasatospora sp. NPDC058190]|uniref:sigma factor-like helix-turn-helix DNA-binding protein n=1 Tax=Kitasatospora sp. NPDC058190 TaxID=3346371 RepID=UPI0036DAE894
MTTPPTHATDPPRKLTPGESQVLAHLAAGHDLQHTAAALGVTPTAARDLLHRALRKLGCLTEAAAIALIRTAPPVRAGRRPPVPHTSTRAAPTASGEHGGMTATPAATRSPASGEPDRRDQQHRSPVVGTEHGQEDRGAPRAATPAAPTEPGDQPGSGAAGATAASLAEAAGPATKGQRQGPRRNDTRAPATGEATQHRAPAAGDATSPGAARVPATPDPAATGEQGAAARRRLPTAPTEPGTSARGQAMTDAPTPRQHPSTAPAEQPPAPRHDRPTAPLRQRDTGPPRQHPPTAPADARKRGGAATGRSASAERQSVPRQEAPSPADRRERIDMALIEAGSRRDLSDEPVAGFDDLYEEAHTRLVQQVFLLTAARHRAVHCVRQAFGEARRGWAEVVGSGDPEAWVRVRACELALSPWHWGELRRAHAWTLPHRRTRVRPADEAQAVLPDQDRLTDRDRALLKALRQLSRQQRRALVLHDGLGLPAAAIAVEVESTRTAAEGRVWAARAALAQWVPELVGPDPAAPGFADGLSGLLHRAAVRGCPEPHRSPVPLLRARHRVWTASRTGAAALLTLAVGGATLATLAGLRPAALFESYDPPAPTLCVPAPDAKVAPPGVPLLPGGAPNGIASLWCSPAPGLAAAVVDPQPRAVAGWELPASAEVQAPPPRQGPAVCPLWSPLPCTTGPKR